MKPDRLSIHHDRDNLTIPEMLLSLACEASIIISAIVLLHTLIKG